MAITDNTDLIPTYTITGFTIGDTVTINLRCYTSTGVFSLTGYTLICSFVSTGFSTITKSSPSTGITVSDAANGLAQLVLSPSDTDAVTSAVIYNFQLRAYTASITYTLAEGTISFKKETTEIP